MQCRSSLCYLSLASCISMSLCVITPGRYNQHDIIALFRRPFWLKFPLKTLLHPHFPCQISTKPDRQIYSTPTSPVCPFRELIFLYSMSPPPFRPPTLRPLSKNNDALRNVVGPCSTFSTLNFKSRVISDCTDGH